MRYDLVVRGGSVVTPDGVARLAVAVADGVIAELAEEVEGSAAEEVDATGMAVMPGAIDAHVHFNDPGRAEWEGFESGSAAVAAGGGSCFLDMPLNASPPTLDGDSFDRKLAAARGRSAVDFGLWGGLTPGNLDSLDELADRGVVGFKAFMSGSGIPDFERADDRTLLAGMRAAARLDLPVAVHAEDEESTAALAAAARGAGRRSVRDYLDSRPVAAEVAAIERALGIAAETGCALHVVHVSSAAGVLAVAEARARGVDASCETCPHYLLLSDEAVERLGAVAKCAPPLRPAREVEALWARLLAGDVQLVASDHSPSPPEMKRADDFFEVWGGVAGCQSMLPALIAEGHLARGLPLERVAELVTGAPARRFGLPRKGGIAVGNDADLALVHPGGGEPLREEHLAYRHRVSPYLGRPLHGLVRRTIVRGVTVFREGAPTAARPGRLVTPARGVRA